jgi:mRNA interferase RelE/StbE
MEYSAEYSRAAEKYLDKQTRDVQKRILDAVDELPNGDVKKLQGRDGYRLTVGGYRILFEYTDRKTDDGEIIIDVLMIGPRGDIYKK